MKKDIRTKSYLLVKRFKLIKFLVSEDYSGADIAVIFNIPESSISRILDAGEKYKVIAKKVLSDKLKW